MPDKGALVVNTGPLLALTAATGDLKLLESFYARVIVPSEVCLELRQGGVSGFGMEAFEKAIWLEKRSAPQELSPLLLNSLDTGEAAVIQLALREGIDKVAIDETAGRRVARLSGLALTGSLGILLRAKKEGLLPSLKTAIAAMQRQRIWLSESIIVFALKQAGE